VRLEVRDIGDTGASRGRDAKRGKVGCSCPDLRRRFDRPSKTAGIRLAGNTEWKTLIFEAILAAS
jgi:hypothetical protein